MIKMPNLLLIGAEARNTGKTELACKIIKKFETIKIIGIKVTTINEKSNGCPSGRNCGVCTSLKENYSITEEKYSSHHKDTARLLQSGAFRVYWLKVLKEYIKQGVTDLLKKIEKDRLLVCESNSIRNIIEPGIFVITKNKQDKKIKPSCQEVRQFADQILTVEEFDYFLQELDYSVIPDNFPSWYLNKTSNEKKPVIQPGI